MTKQKMVVIAILVYLILRIFVLEPNALEVKNYWIEDRKLSGIKIAFLTDFNIKRNGYKRLKQIVDKTNELNPSVVLLGGDFVYDSDIRKTLKLSQYASALANIQAKTYAVLGDDDWRTNNGDAIARALKENRIYVLKNSAVRVLVAGKYLDIAGVVDKSYEQPNISKALYRTRRPRILLSHNPDIYYDVMDDVDLILAGHTHGGQVVIPFTPPLFVPSQYGSKFASGAIRETNNSMIISKGLGTNKFPGRLNCKPEIVIVNFVLPGHLPPEATRKTKK